MHHGTDTKKDKKDSEGPLNVEKLGPKKAERSIFITLIFENIAYFDFIR